MALLALGLGEDLGAQTGFSTGGDGVEIRSAQGSALTDVVISGGGPAARSFDAPGAVQVVPAEAIQSAGPRVNLSESIPRVPGVATLNRQNYAQDLQLSIRGFGARSAFGIRGVRLIVDGIPATMPDGQGQAATLSLGSIERIEVLRGPWAVLHGNAAGGVIQAFTRAGAEPVGASLSHHAGSNGLWRIEGQGWGRQGPMDWRVDASSLGIEGERAHAAARRRQLNARLGIGLGDATTLTLVAQEFEQPWAQDPLGLTRAQMAADPRQTQPIAWQQDTGKSVSQRQAGAVLAHRVSDGSRLELRLWGGERGLFQKLAVPASAQLSAGSSGGIVDLDRSYGGVAIDYTDRRRLGAGEWVNSLGLEYEWMNERRRGFVNADGRQGALKRDEDDRVSSRGLRWRSEWLINADWTVLAGVRWSRIAFDSADHFIVPGNPDDSGGVRYQDVNPVIGVIRHFGERVNLHASWGRGMETPTLAELAYRRAGLEPGLNTDLKAARSTQAEIGLKSRIGDHHRFDVALYRVRSDAELVVDVSEGGRTSYRNAGATRRQGIELSYGGQLGAEWSALLAITTVQATFEADAANGALAGRSLPGVPRRFAYGELAWTPGPTRLPRPLTALRPQVAVEMVYAGRIQVDDANTDATASRAVFNLRMNLNQELGRWRFSQFIRIDNVGNRRYAGSVVVNDANRRFFEPAPGRTWMLGVQARYSFR